MYNRGNHRHILHARYACVQVDICGDRRPHVSVVMSAQMGSATDTKCRSCKCISRRVAIRSRFAATCQHAQRCGRQRHRLRAMGPYPCATSVEVGSCLTSRLSCTSQGALVSRSPVSRSTHGSPSCVVYRRLRRVAGERQPRSSARRFFVDNYRRHSLRRVSSQCLCERAHSSMRFITPASTFYHLVITRVCSRR